MTPTPAAARRRDADATRELILTAARTLFAASGFGPTTVKRIADAAGVSPNLITRYFGGKEGLFLAAARVAIAVDDVYTGELAGFGDRLARSILRRWSGQTPEDPLLVLHRAAGERPEAAEALALFLDEHSTARIDRYLRSCGLSPQDARDRAEAVDALVLGLSTRHRILRADLAEGEDGVRWLAAAVQRLVAR